MYEGVKFMKKFVRIGSIIVAAVLMFVVTVTPAFAAGFSSETYVGSPSRFSSEWEKTLTYMVGSTTIAYMIYGFDTDWVKEDYVWTKAKECYSTAKVKRKGHETEYCVGPEKGKNEYSQIEVKHETYFVYYRIELSATYSGVGHTMATSSVK